MMNRLLITDPLTRKKSLTVSMLIWSFVVYMVAVGFYLAGKGDLKVVMVSLFGVGIFFAGYRQKRLKLSFTGMEIEQDQGVCDVGTGKPN
jgi:hypothetical protein